MSDVFVDTQAIVKNGNNDALQAILDVDGNRTFLTSTVIGEVEAGGVRNRQAALIIEDLIEYQAGLNSPNLFELHTEQVPRVFGGVKNAGDLSIEYVINGQPSGFSITFGNLRR